MARGISPRAVLNPLPGAPIHAAPGIDKPLELATVYVEDDMATRGVKTLHDRHSDNFCLQRHLLRRLQREPMFNG